MKRFALAALVALAVTVGVEQKASASGFGLKCSIGFSFSCRFSCNPWCSPCGYPCTYSGCGYGSYYPCFNYGGCPTGCSSYEGWASPYGYSYSHDAAPYYAPAYAAQSYDGGAYYANSYQAAPQPTVAPAYYAPQATTQQIGYYPYAYTNAYGYQAPNYWYGR